MQEYMADWHSMDAVVCLWRRATFGRYHRRRCVSVALFVWRQVTTGSSWRKFHSLQLLRSNLCPRPFTIWKLAVNIRILRDRTQFMRAREVVDQWHITTVMLYQKRKVLLTNAQGQWLRAISSSMWERWQANVKTRSRFRRLQKRVVDGA